MRRHTILMLSFAVSACATNGSGDGGLTIETTSKGQVLIGASCVAQTSAGNWNVTTPGVIYGVRPVSDLHVVCNKTGYRTSELIYRPEIHSGASLGIGLGGGSRRAGVGLGMSVPIAAGHGDYPARVTVDMNAQ